MTHTNAQSSEPLLIDSLRRDQSDLIRGVILFRRPGLTYSSSASTSISVSTSASTSASTSISTPASTSL
ncbi:hypothetical protein IQ07DRAFT_31531 [Pyrenochaeta sp. DS3sAY3a]|nr:hypothetical protein IQ07DRAFT_31531 [Pyrenochaeta sp. DS3sAY3a]